MITKTINKEGEGGAIDKIVTETKLHAYLEPLILQNLFDGHHLLCVDEASLVHHTKRPIPNDLQGFNRTGESDWRTAHQVINHKHLFNFLKAAAAGVSILLTVINWLDPSLTDSLFFSESLFQAYSAYDDSSVEICHSNNHKI